MNIILFDWPTTKANLLPFTFTRPIADIRIGILTIKEKWQKMLPADYSYLTDDYLNKKFPYHTIKSNLYLNGSVSPDANLIAAILALKENQLLKKGETPIAFCGNVNNIEELKASHIHEKLEEIEYSENLLSINHPYDIFANNREALIRDFELITKGRESQKVEDPHTIVYNSKDVFVEEGAKIRSAILNAEYGPIYIGRRAEIGEGSIVRGATVICEHGVLNLGTKIRGDATIGPFSKVGGEIVNSVIFANSNKAHDGYLGNSVIGEWCNLGADTNTSNMKNNYKNVRLWNYAKERFLDTGRQFCGLMMGDHSKCSINTMFNTGTLVGVSANVFGHGFPRVFIPSFSYGGMQGVSTYPFAEAKSVAEKVLERRKKALSEVDVEILTHIFEATKKYRPGQR